ncbi:hypothetical protein FQZ97_588130 [compost metagenome]
MPEGQHDVGAGRRRADARQAVGQARAVSEPVRHRRRTGRGRRQRRKHRLQMRVQDLGAAPVGRRFEARDLHLAGRAQAAVHPVRDEFAVGHHGRRARAGRGAFEHHVVAALGLQRHRRACRRGQRARARTGADGGAIAGDLAGLGAHGAQPAALDAKAGGPRGDAFGARSERMVRQGRHVGARIAAVAGFGHEDAERVARGQIGLAAAQFVRRPFFPLDTGAPAHAPAQRVAVELGA